MSYPIVGQYFRPPAGAILQVLPAGATLILRPEPSNPFDPNAVQVLVKTTEIPREHTDILAAIAQGQGYSAEDIFAAEEWHLGYISKNMACDLVKTLPAGDTQAMICFSPSGSARLVLKEQEAE